MDMFCIKFKSSNNQVVVIGLRQNNVYHNVYLIINYHRYNAIIIKQLKAIPVDKG